MDYAQASPQQYNTEIGMQWVLQLSQTRLHQKACANSFDCKRYLQFCAGLRLRSYGSAFEPYWGGEVYLDQNKELFALVGGGQLRQQSAWRMLNPFSIVWKAAMEAKDSVDKFNFQGDGTIMGGIVVMRPVINEVEYIFPESEFGTYPNVEEIIKASTAASATQERSEAQQKERVSIRQSTPLAVTSQVSA